MEPLNLPKVAPLERRPDLLDPTRPRYDPTTRVPRYRAGFVPEYAIEKVDENATKRRRVAREDDEDSSESSSESEDISKEVPPSKPIDFSQVGLRKRQREMDSDEDDRPNNEPVAEVLDSDVEMDLAGPAAEVLEDSEDDSADSEQERRKRLKRLERESKLAERTFDHHAEGFVLQEINEKVDNHLDSSSSESEVGEEAVMLKPVFRRSDQRVALANELEEELRQQEEERAREEKAAANRLLETKELLERALADAKAAEEIERARKETGQEAWSDSDLPDDKISDEVAAYAAWQLRELGRLRRDYMREMKRQEEEEWVERRREMTEEERKADDAKLDAKAPKQVKKGSMGFMQKYYHKGAFFQEPATGADETVFRKDFAAPVPEDAVDQLYTPKAMQLRRGEWGRKGRSKHTHLRDVDTTDRSAAWAKDETLKLQERKMGGLKGSDQLDRPSHRKK